MCMVGILLYAACHNELAESFFIYQIDQHHCFGYVPVYAADCEHLVIGIEN